MDPPAAPRRNSFELKIDLLPYSGAGLGALIVAWCAYAAFHSGFTSPNGPATAVGSMKPCFFVTGAWMGLLYTFLFMQSAAAFYAHSELKAQASARGEKPLSYKNVKYSIGGAASSRVLAMDRTVANYLEQSLPLLLGLYIHAVLVSPNAAAVASWLWILSRSYYPFLFNVRGPCIFLSTLPAYTCVAYLWYGALSAAILM